MAVYSSILPVRFSVHPQEWATPYNGMEFSNSNLRAIDTVPFSFGSQNGLGGPAFVTISAIPAAVQDQEVLALFPVFSGGSGTCCVRGNKGGTTNSDGVTRAEPSSATNILVRTRHSAGAFETNGNIDITGKAWPIMVRLRVEGITTTTIRCKAWSIYEDEPASWDIDTTSTRPRDDGYPGLFKQGNGIFNLSHHSVATAGDTATMFMGAISGTVVVAPDTAVERPVRAVARDNPDLFFETVSAVDGTYRLPVLLGYDYTVYAMDDTDTYNAQIKDMITGL